MTNLARRLSIVARDEYRSPADSNSVDVVQWKNQGGAPRRQPSDVTRLTIFTIGHSTRPIDEFLRLLKAHGVQRVVDVRTIPRSRHNPQFNRGNSLQLCTA
jgi:hypothetical protein